MELLSFNKNYTNDFFSNEGVSSTLKEITGEKFNIHQGMSVTEISEFVSEKIITVVKEQFEETRTLFILSETDSSIK